MYFINPKGNKTSVLFYILLCYNGLESVFKPFYGLSELGYNVVYCNVKWGDLVGKVVTIYLSDEEARDLKGFCDENRCTQYSALKTAVKQLLYRPVESAFEDTWVEDTSNDEDQEEDTELGEETEEIEEIEENKTQDHMSELVRKIREAYKKQEETSPPD